MVSDVVSGDPIPGAERNRSMQNKLVLVEQYKEIFRSLREPELYRLRFIYANDVVYRDSIRETRGLVMLEDHFASLCARYCEYRFEFIDQQIGERSVYLKWNLHYRPSSVNGPPQSLRGVSHLQIGDRIEFQENFYECDQQGERHTLGTGTIGRWFGRRPARKTASIGS